MEYRVRFVADGVMRAVDYFGCDLERIRAWVYQELYRLYEVEPNHLWTATITEGTSFRNEDGTMGFTQNEQGAHEGHLLAYAALLDGETKVDKIFGLVSKP
jgi:hypothetical protein